MNTPIPTLAAATSATTPQATTTPAPDTPPTPPTAPVTEAAPAETPPEEGEEVVAAAPGGAPTPVPAEGTPEAAPPEFFAAPAAPVVVEKEEDDTGAAASAPSLAQEQEAFQILNALAAGVDISAELAATAAGLTGGTDQEAGFGFVRLDRISESTTDPSFAFDNPPPAEIVIKEELVLSDNPVSITGLTPSSQGGDTNVNESGLDTGSAPGQAPITGIGNFFISAPDGYDDLTVTLESQVSPPLVVISDGVLTNNTTIISDNGLLQVTITNFDPVTGEVGYSYTLINPADHPLDVDTIFDNFTVTLTDIDGDSATDTLSIGIRDDAPIAHDDSASLTEDTDAVSGNVVVNNPALTEPGDDVPGADGASVTTTGSFPGAHGTLTLASDGAWTYDLNEGSVAVQGLGGEESFTETFDYTLTDTDGDSDSAVLTITIQGVDDPVVIGGLAEEGPDASVDEDDLPDGSDTSKESLTDGGSFTIQADDGIGSLTVAGHVFSFAQLSSGLPQSFSTDLGNTFTLTGYSGTVQGGTVSYSYTLNDNEAHPADAGQNSLLEDLSVTLTDDDGDSVNDTLTVQIVDDVPTAANDSAALGEDTSSVSGNVMSNDVEGADQAAVTTTGVFAGEHGSLTLAADGSWTYDLDESSVAVQGLGGGESFVETFDYTLTDGDADPSSATLTITINGQDDPPSIGDLTPAEQGGDTSVDEDDLPDGSDTSKESLTGTGTFTLTAVDGIGSLTVAGHSYSFATLSSGLPQSFTTDLGNTFTITGYSGTVQGGTVSYSYTLLDNEAHSAAAGQNNLFEDLGLTLTDDDGDTASGTLSVRIVDDVPTAANDSATISEDTDAISGNVMSNDVEGADGAAVTTTGVFAGAHGTLTLAADGSWTYDLDETSAAVQGLAGEETLTETFNYTLTDGDADPSTATLTITIDGQDDPPEIRDLTPSIQGGDTSVDEDDLPDGSDTSKESTSGPGTFTLIAGDGVGTLTVDGHSYTLADLTSGLPQSFTTALGNTLTLTGYSGDQFGGVVSYSYTLNDNEAHSAGDGQNNLFEDLALTLTDEDGDIATGTLSARIVDDVPSASDDSAALSEDTSAISGNVMSNDVEGADGAAVTTTGVFAGAHGSLTLAADGSWTYDLDESSVAVQGLGSGQSFVETFDYTITDGDADPSSATLTITINGQDDPPSIGDLTPAEQGGDTSVDEDDLPDGSDTSKESLTGTGTFTITAVDGIGSLTVAGHSYSFATLSSGLPQSFTTALGNSFTLTGYSGTVQGGTVSYSYTLLDNEAHSPDAGQNNLFEDLALTLTDDDGDLATGTLSVRIVDDVPTANDDSASIGEDSDFITGNVMSNDVEGADQADVTTTGVFAGDHGTLTLASDGSWTYDLDETSVAVQGLGDGQTFVENFDYTITDGDADPSSATLTITINGQDDPPNIGGLTPASEGGDTSVDEDDLPDGSDTTKESLTGTGTFTLTAVDGIGSLTIAGHTYSFATLSGGLPQSFTTALGNSFTLTGYSGTVQGGTVSYSYTLLDNESHSAGSGQNNLFEDLGLTLTDDDGDTATGTLSVRIVDDVPTANDDSASLSEDTDFITGNVMTNDVEGADQADVTTTGVFAGAHGTLTLASDGSWTYDLDQTAVDVQGLGSGQSFVENFDYTITDGDADPSSATLTITINGQDDPPNIGGLTPKGEGGDTSVDEDDLADGSDTTPESTTGVGDFTITAVDGIGSLTIAGHSYSFATLSSGLPQSFTTALGNTFTLTGYAGTVQGGTVSYSYELLDNESHSAGAGQNNLFEDLGLTLTDDDGDTATGTLSVRIVDDVPTAADDAAAISEETDFITGNVMTNDVEGADQADVTTPGVYAGSYGTLTLGADGAWTYDLNNADPVVQGLGDGDSLTENFDYTITDGDSDPSSATLTITILAAEDPPHINDLTPKEQGGDTVVDEDDLADGSDTTPESTTGLGTFSITAVDGVASLSIAGHVYTLANLQSGLPQSFTTALGNTFTVTGYTGNDMGGTVSYSYELLDNEAHSAGAGQNNLFEDLALTLTDDDGDLATGTLSVRIVDDVPTANDDSDSIGEDTDFITGNVMTNDVEGADQADVTTTGVFAGAHGSLTLAADGSWTYDLDETSVAVQGLGDGQTFVENFDYTITDGDSDPSTATLTITINGEDDPPSIGGLTPKGEGGDTVVDEDDLADGSDTTPESTTGVGDFTITAVDGIGSLTIAGHTYSFATLSGGLPQSFTTALGNTFTLTGYAGTVQGGTVSYSYELLDNEAHSAGAGQNNLFEDLGLTLTDDDGDTATGTLSVRIVDDVPDAIDDLDPDVVSENATVTTGDVDANDIPGADGASVTPAVLAGIYGSLTLLADGSYTYTLNPADPDFIALTGGGTDTEVFTYTYTDGDDDVDTADLTIQIQNDDDDVTITDLTPKGEGGDAVVDEEALSDGTNPSSTAETTTGSFTLTGPDGIASLSIDGDGAPTVISFAALANSGTVPIVITTDLGNTLTIDGYSGDAFGGTVSYSYTLNDNETHADDAGENDLFDDLGVVVTDSDGDTDSGTLSIRIIDDVPVVLDKTDLIYANGSNPSPGGTGVFDYNIGADRRTSYSSLNSDFSAILLSGLVGAAAISDTSVTWVSETGNTAVFDVHFKYAANPLTPLVLSDADGTLTFDKDAGTYTLSLDAPINSFTVLNTSSTISEENFNTVGSSEAQPEIVVSKLANDFFVRFTGAEEGPGDPVDFKTSSGDMAFANGEVFVGVQTWVSISGSENGVASDTLQAGEILNMEFYTTSPGGNPSPAMGDARASGMYLKLGQLGAGEDFIVVLKLVDPDDSSTTTKAIIIEYGDIWLSSETNPYGITFTDGSDGVMIIESNDYNGAGENYQIYGAQLLVSTEDVTGSGVNLVRDTGPTGGSSGTQLFEASGGVDTTDNDVIKIVDIGIITATTNTQDANLQFDVTLHDTDGDATGTQELNVALVNGNTFIGTAADESLQGTDGNDSFTGGLGADVFAWNLGDGGVDGTPTQDTVTDFSLADGDQLKLADLLVGEHDGSGVDPSNLTDYLHFTASGGDTTIHISSDGEYSGGFSAAETNQEIQLTAVDLVALYGPSDADIISSLVSSNKLIVDV